MDVKAYCERLNRINQEYTFKKIEEILTRLKALEAHHAAAAPAHDGPDEDELAHPPTPFETATDGRD